VRFIYSDRRRIVLAAGWFLQYAAIAAVGTREAGTTAAGLFPTAKALATFCMSNSRIDPSLR